ncbi:MAG: hypothetical protein KA104_00655 [Candidatus Pacebacteria bacterium]|nr:hypothetical protein [Candidatus Paceibacterota bacterium]
MEKEYAQAVAEMSRREGADEANIVSGLMRELKANNRSKLLPGILRELRTMQARANRLAPVLEVASAKEETRGREAMKKEGIEIERVIVNPSLIQGWRARANGLLWDQSAKRALTDIYKKITN